MNFTRIVMLSQFLAPIPSSFIHSFIFNIFEKNLIRIYFDQRDPLRPPTIGITVTDYFFLYNMDSEQKAEIKSDLLIKTEINSKFIYGGS